MDLPIKSSSSYISQAHYDAIRLERFKSELKTDKGILPENKVSLMKFISHMETRGVTVARLRCLMDDIIWCARLTKKPWMECTRDDINELMSTLRRTDYAGWSKLRKAFALKTFYKWLNGGDTCPPCVAKINRTELNFPTHDLESRDILSREDMEKMLKACNSELESAILYTLWECGARSSEFIRLVLADIEDKGTYYVVHIRTSKVRFASSTPKVRKFPLVESVPFLRAYLNKHPRRSDPTAPLWLSNSQNRRGQQLTDRGLRYLVKNIGKRANLNKRVWVHQFRHSAATRMAPKLALPIMNDIMGWSKTSNMHATYVQLDGDVSKNAVLGLYGMNAPENAAPKPIEMIPCPACKAANQPGNIMCANCGRALSTLGAVSVMDELEQMKKKMEKMMMPAARGTVARAKREAARRMAAEKKE